MTGMLLAHVSSSGGGGGGGTNVLAGLAVVAAAVRLRATRRLPGPAILAIVGSGVLLAVAGFVSRSDKRPEVTLTLLSPDPGASVRPDQPVPVSVEVVGGKVARSPAGSGGHLHLSVDGVLEQMPYWTTTEVSRPRGRHTLRVEYVDEEHVSYEPPIAVEVRVDAF